MDHMVVDVVVGEVTILVAKHVENERHKYEEPYEAPNDVQGRCHQINIVVDARLPILLIQNSFLARVELSLFLSITFLLRVSDRT